MGQKTAKIISFTAPNKLSSSINHPMRDHAGTGQRAIFSHIKSSNDPRRSAASRGPLARAIRWMFYYYTYKVINNPAALTITFSSCYLPLSLVKCCEQWCEDPTTIQHTKRFTIFHTSAVGRLKWLTIEGTKQKFYHVSFNHILSKMLLKYGDIYKC